MLSGNKRESMLIIVKKLKMKAILTGVYVSLQSLERRLSFLGAT